MSQVGIYRPVVVYIIPRHERASYKEWRCLSRDLHSSTDFVRLPSKSVNNDTLTKSYDMAYQ